ncbi:hypothetical protein [Microbacterium sp. NPDC089188]|uniref:hypothetical protein n=1 Tax=Microbacterium sp. NPDC089188 TaxID=3154971 RepID=UPI003412657E
MSTLLKIGVERVRLLSAGDTFDEEMARALGSLEGARHAITSQPPTQTALALQTLFGAAIDLRLAVVHAFTYSVSLGALQEPVAIADDAGSDEDPSSLVERFFLRIRDLEQSMVVEAAAKQIEVATGKLPEHMHSEFG